MTLFYTCSILSLIISNFSYYNEYATISVTFRCLCHTQLQVDKIKMFLRYKKVKICDKTFTFVKFLNSTRGQKITTLMLQYTCIL